jgi:hypothetical protein
MGIIRNAWEVDNDEQMVLALAGHATREEYLQIVGSVPRR